MPRDWGVDVDAPPEDEGLEWGLEPGLVVRRRTLGGVADKVSKGLGEG